MHLFNPYSQTQFHIFFQNGLKGLCMKINFASKLEIHACSNPLACQDKVLLSATVHRQLLATVIN